jgi:hypothetical protein
VVWNIVYFSIIYGKFIIPIDELIFFRGVGIPPTTNQNGLPRDIIVFSDSSLLFFFLDHLRLKAQRTVGGIDIHHQKVG